MRCSLVLSDVKLLFVFLFVYARFADTLLPSFSITSGCSASPHSDDNLFVWSATICGPKTHLGEGGIFSLRLTFSDSYPASAPLESVLFEMFHPNIYPDGTLCMDTIQEQWSPVHSVASLLTSVRSLLCDPNVNSPANSRKRRRCWSRRKRSIIRG